MPPKRWVLLLSLFCRDEQTNTERLRNFARGHSAGRWQSQESNPGHLTPHQAQGDKEAVEARILPVAKGGGHSRQEERFVQRRVGVEGYGLFRMVTNSGQGEGCVRRSGSTWSWGLRGAG